MAQKGPSYLETKGVGILYCFCHNQSLAMVSPRREFLGEVVLIAQGQSHREGYTCDLAAALIVAGA